MANETGVTPIRWDLTGEDALTQGADWMRYVALYSVNPSTGEEVVWDTTGYTAQMFVRKDHDSPILLSLTTANGRITTGLLNVGGQQWSMLLHVTAAATARTTAPALDSLGLGVYDLELTDPYGVVTRVYDGRISIRREATYGS
jgi:hypothetical protein